MATANSNTEQETTGPAWPQEPEALLSFVPDDLEGSPYDMLFNILMRATGVVSLLCAEFMGEGEYRPTDPEIANALWAVKSQLQMAVDLLE